MNLGGTDVLRYEKMRSIIINEQGNLNIIGKLFYAALVIIIASILVGLIKRAINRALKYRGLQSDSKIKTFQQILTKIIYVFAYFIAIVLILDRFGINTNSILATAGIGGVAIGFGAQYVVRDVISGMIILAEDQYRVGDYVSIEGVSGIIEDVGLRLTKVRDFTGELHIIQNGNIKIVTNKSRGPQRAWVQVYLPHSTDIKAVTSIIEGACEKVKEKYPSITDGPSLLGITDFGEYDMVMSIKAMVEDLKHWEVERELRKTILEDLVAEGIELPAFVVVEGGAKDEV